MKKLKLFALMIVVTIILASCSSTTEKSAEVQEQSSEEVIASNDIDEIQEAVEEAMIEEEGMEIEEQEVVEDEDEGEVKPQSSTKTEKPKNVETKQTKTSPKTSTKIESAKSTPKKSTNKTTSKPIAETKRKKSTDKSTDKSKLKTNKEPSEKFKGKTKTSSKPSHSAFNTLLNKYVTSSGTVNYAGFKSQKSALNNYLKKLEENPVQSSWSKNEKMAYWINLYNAATIKLILDNYPTSSIQNINSGKPWDKRWIKSGSKTYTLNEIENSILRPQFKDPRIHFAVNCAAQSCPRLMNKAFTASNLNSLMDENARWFINNSTFNDISTKKVEISKIFEWYAVDFGNIIDYLNKYSTTTIKSNAKVTYKAYDWKLNGK